jgi:4-amino-4-deoxy-L-arabinose transferase-like glycosyltransferase
MTAASRTTAAAGLRWPVWLDAGVAYPMIAALLLLGLCLVLFLPGLVAIPPVDRDEARFAQASRQMVESGNFVDIRFQDAPRHKKPIGIYWLQAASVATAADGAQSEIWRYRLPSLAGACAAVLLTVWAGSPLVGRRAALLSATMLAGCLLLGVEARLAKTDAVLLALVVAAQGALARVYLATGERPTGLGPPALFWSALGGGVLVKGPVILLVSGGTILALALVDRDRAWLRRLRWPTGLLWLAAIVAPWLLAITLASEGAFFDAFGRDSFGKLLQVQESHGAPPGSYLLALWLTFWPGSLLAGLALPWIWQQRRTPAVRFCLAWLLPTWLVFELAITKLPHYVLPTYPAIALMAGAAMLTGFGLGERRWPAWRFWLPAGLWLAPTFGLALAVAGLPWLIEARIDPLALAAAGMALLAGLAALAFAWQRRIVATLAALLVAAAALQAGAFGRVLPGLDRLWPASRLQAAVAASAPCPGPAAVAVAGYHEPSVVFLLGTATRLTQGADAAAWLARDPCHLAVVEARQEAAFRAALAAEGLTAPALRATVEGVNFNGGDRLVLRLYARAINLPPNRR